MRHKLLLITYAFPPISAPESYLCAKALSALKDFDVEVITIDPRGLGIAIDKSMLPFVGKHFKFVHYVSAPKWLGVNLFYMLRFLIVFPDRFSIFNSAMLEAALRINIDNFDVLMSWSQWHSVHLVAANVKRKFPGIPWIAHLSDPWADNPFLPRIPGFAYVQRLIERAVIRVSDSIQFTTVETQKLVMRNYPEEYYSKTHVLPHCYVSSLYQQHGKVQRKINKWVIRYLGNFYGPRNPVNLARALSYLQRESPFLLEGVTVELVGKWLGNERWLPCYEGVEGGLLVFRKPVEYYESLSLMCGSDLLLIVDAPFEQSVFFPSKLVDYIGANRPIFAITPEGACADILRKVGGIIASPNSVKEISDGLAVAITKMKAGNAPVPDPNIAIEYEAASVGEKYDKLLGALIDA